MMTTNNNLNNFLRYYYYHYYYYNYNNYICIFNSLHLLLLLLITIIIVPLSSTTQSTTKYINNEGTTTTTTTSRILFTPENIRYSFNRCQNDSNLNFDQILIWMPWRLSSLLNGEKHNDINVNCLIKCILMKLGLINLKHRGLDDEKFLNQIFSRGFQHNNNNNIDQMMILDYDDNDDNKHENELESLLKGPLDGTCQSYHNKWIELIENYGQIIRKSFYGYKNDIIKFYQSDNDNNDKNIGETSIEFCNKKILFNYNKNLPQINLNMHPFSIILMNNIYKCYLKCIFVHFHYFDAYGRVDISEVIRSVQESGFMNSCNLRKIYICVHTANQLFLQGLCNVAYELYSCLSLNVYGAKNIITYRNELTRYY